VRKKQESVTVPGLTKENFKNWITMNSKMAVNYLAGLNRGIIPAHVTTMTGSITKIGIIRPIVLCYISFIDGIPGWYIVDGQHLFNALLRISADVPYTIITVADKRDLVNKIALLNASSKNWALKDYVNAWSSLESDYVKLNNYFNIYDLEIGMLATILSNNTISRCPGGSTIVGKIKSGQFKIVEEEKAILLIDRLTDVLNNLNRQTRQENIYLCSEYVSFYKNCVNYDHKKFMKKLKTNKKQFELATQQQGKLKEMFETLK